jgi:MFS family permease
MAALSATRAKSARLALVAMYFIQGCASTALVPRIPELVGQVNANLVMWGTVIGVAGLGSFFPLMFTNRLVARFGTRPVIRIASAFIAIILALIPWSTSIWMFFGLQAVNTMAFSSFNIAINSASVMLQKKVKTTIVGSMHAAWSLGAAASAALSGALVTLLPFKTHLGLVALFCLLAFQLIGRTLLEPAQDGHKTEAAREEKVSWLKTPAFVWVLTAGLFCGVWPEIVMIDWSALFSKQVMNLNPAMSAIPYTVFTVAMIIGRLSINRTAERLHISELSKWGGTIGSALLFVGIFVGPLVAQTNAALGLILLCLLWGLAGLGVGPQVPSFFTAGGYVMGLSTAQALSRMSMLNMFLMLGAKFVMGAIAQQNLQAAFLFPATTLLLAGVISGIVVKRVKRNENEMLTAFPPTSPIVVIDD